MSLLHEPGNLSRTPLAAILLDALNHRAEGVLEVGHGGGTSRLWLKAGQPVGAQVFSGFRPLGHMLLQAGRIDVDALSRSLAEMAGSGRPQGEILVAMGAVSREDVDAALEEQQASYFALIAALDEGTYRFDAAQPVPAWTGGCKLSPLRTIVDALERPQAGALVVSALQPVAQGGARLATGYAEVEPAFRWAPPERRLVGRLIAPTTLDGFFADADGVSPERARAMLAALLLLGLAVPAAENPSPSGDTLAGLTLAGLSPEPLPQHAEAAAVAGASPSSPAVPLRRSDPAEARARRQRLLARAMQNMGVGPFGARPSAPGHPPGQASGQGGGESAPAAAAPPPAAAPGSAENALRQALLDVSPRARERSLFARLGLAEGAGKDEVKKAFLQIARQFHPDRFSAPGLADLAGTVRDFFTAVNEAYEVLSDDRKRAGYLAAVKGGSANPQRSDSAKVDFQKGEACLRTRDFARARGFLESAVRADPRAEYQAALAWTYVVDPVGRDLPRARGLLAEAVKDLRCDRAQYVAGVVAREEGQEAEAERHFRAAVAANPRHGDALRELKALEGRRGLHRR